MAGVLTRGKLKTAHQPFSRMGCTALLFPGQGIPGPADAGAWRPPAGHKICTKPCAGDIALPLCCPELGLGDCLHISSHFRRVTGSEGPCGPQGHTKPGLRVT